MRVGPGRGENGWLCVLNGALLSVMLHVPSPSSILNVYGAIQFNAGFRLHYFSSMSTVTSDSYNKHMQIITTIYPMHAYTCCLKSQANPRGIVYIKS